MMYTNCSIYSDYHGCLSFNFLKEPPDIDIYIYRHSSIINIYIYIYIFIYNTAMSENTSTLSV